MKTAACCRKANSSSGGIPSRFDGVEVNFSVENIQLNLAFGNVGADEFVVVVDDDDDDVVVGCILIVLEFR
jgi:hypothetical protein